jgi:hypothetical protein
MNSISNEGYFTLEAGSVFRPYLASHCKGVTDTAYVALFTQGLQTVQVCSNLVTNDEHFTHVAARAFHPSLVYQFHASIANF